MTTYTAPKLTQRQQAALDQGLLPFMLRFGGRPTVRVDEVARETSVSRDLLYDLISAGELEVLKATAVGKGKESKKPTYIVMTRSVIFWMLKNSNVDPVEWEDSLTQWLALQPRAALERIAALTAARLSRTTR